MKHRQRRAGMLKRVTTEPADCRSFVGRRVCGTEKETHPYKHFREKERLFTEVILESVEAAGTELVAEINALGESNDPARDLKRLARLVLSTLMQPALLQRRRAVIAEANRLPEFGRDYYDRTYGRSAAVLAASLRRLNERGLLEVPDADIAAQQFIWLTIGAPRNRVMLCGDDIHVSSAELNRIADSATGVFLAAYGNASRPKREP